MNRCLTGIHHLQMGSADIQGLPSQGVMAQVEHYTVDNQKTNRNSPADNAIIEPAQRAVPAGLADCGVAREHPGD